MDSPYRTSYYLLMVMYALNVLIILDRRLQKLGALNWIFKATQRALHGSKLFMLCHTSLLIAFSVSHATFYKNFTLSRHFLLIFYIHLYYNYMYKTFVSIFIFYKISTSILQVLQDFDITSTVFIKAHVGFYNF